MVKLIPLAVACLAATSVHASQQIVGLFNTGAGLNEGVQDPHYALFGSGGAGTATITGGLGYVGTNINSNWLANNSSSKWLTPQQGGNDSLDPSTAGTYTWTLSFSLAGFDASTARFRGQYRTDNYGTVKLNGTSLNADILSNEGNFRAGDDWKSFSAGTGLFLAGVNMLVFTVTNLPGASGNPSGLRVEFTESSVTAIPEPQAYGLALAGMGVVMFSLRRRQRSAT